MSTTLSPNNFCSYEASFELVLQSKELGVRIGDRKALCEIEGTRSRKLGTHNLRLPGLKHRRRDRRCQSKGVLQSAADAFRCLMSNWEDEVECSILCSIHRNQFGREVADSVEILLPLNPLEQELRDDVLGYKRFQGASGQGNTQR